MAKEPHEDRLAALEDALAVSHRRLQAVLGALIAMVDQHCSFQEGGVVLDSYALTANKRAMLLLADEGIIEVEPPVVGRRVIARWVKKEEEDGE